MGGLLPAERFKITFVRFLSPHFFMRLLRGMPTLGKLAARSCFPARLLNRW